MATIKVEGNTQQTNNRVEVILVIQTSKGMISLPFRFDHQGSALADEKYAFDELKVCCKNLNKVLKH
jgi:hypothetical protein